MRTITKGTVTIAMPDEVALVFNRSIVRVSASNLKTAYVHVGCGDRQYDVTADAYDGTATVDVSSFLQSIFDDNSFRIDYLSSERMTTGRNVSIYVGYDLSDGTSERGAYEASVFYIWGALMRGETFGSLAKYVAWEGYPFSFPVLALGAGGYRIEGSGGDSDTETIAAMGLYSASPFYFRKGTYNVYNVSAALGRVTFDESFGYTFSTASFSPGDKVAEIDVREGRSGAYLRWIDRHGSFRYWLFEIGDESREVAASGELMRNNLGDTDDTALMLGYDGRRNNYTVERSVELCAALVDGETFDFLQGMTSSPVVDLWLGGNQRNWQSVTVQAGTYTKTRAELQDFVCNIVLDDIRVQRL